MWPEVERRLRCAGRILLLTDFDGTLAPIERDPFHVQIRASIRSSLKRLVKHGVVVGILSGRRLADIRKRTRIAGAWYAGEHGFFLEDPDGCQLAGVPGSNRRKQISRVQRKLAAALRAIPGVWLESKHLTLAVHYRAAPRSSIARARRLLAQTLAAEKSLKVQPNKKVWDVLPDSPVSKWSAVQSILRRVGGPARRRLLIYLGDDTTDEVVFRKMAGISVVVGNKRQSAARYFVRSPSEVGEFLEQLAGLLANEEHGG